MTRSWGGYSAEFRESAAEQALELARDGLSASRACEEVAEAMGCHSNSVRAWTREIEPDFGRSLRADEVPEEITRLRRQVQRLRERHRDDDRT